MIENQDEMITTLEEEKQQKYYSRFLTTIRFWRIRLRFDKGLKYIMIPLFGINLGLEFYLVGMSYIENGIFFRFLMYLSLFALCLFLGRIIPESFEKLINSDYFILLFEEPKRKILKRKKYNYFDKDYTKFKEYVEKVFKWSQIIITNPKGPSPTSWCGLSSAL